MKRLLFVVNDSDYFCAHWLDRAHAALNEGYDVHVSTGDAAGAPRVQAAFPGPVHVTPIVRGKTAPFKEARSIAGLVSLYKKLRPELVHHITIKPVIYGGVAARIAGVPAVVNTVPGLGHLFAHDGLWTRLLRGVVKTGYRLALNNPRSRVIFENHDDLADFERWSLLRHGQGLVIRGAGVDLELFRPMATEAGPPRIVMASRLLWNKGVADFVAAARLIKERRPEFRFILVGKADPGSIDNVPEAQILAWSDEGVIEWWRYRSDMPAVLNFATIVCLPSFYREGVPRVLIEAAACGRPIVTTDMPGCREIVRHGENGFLVRPRDVTVLADTIIRLADDGELCARMGACGRALSEKDYGRERVIAATLQQYRDLLRRDVIMAHEHEPIA